jgi:hypothetical protein
MGRDQVEAPKLLALGDCLNCLVNILAGLGIVMKELVHTAAIFRDFGNLKTGVKLGNKTS